MHLAIDLDNTVMDTTTAGVATLNRLLGMSLDAASTTNYAFFEDFGLCEEWYSQVYRMVGDELHDTPLPYPDALPTLHDLMARHHVTLLTARDRCFTAVTEAWLSRHGLRPHAVHYETDKYGWCCRHGVDLMIDDHVGYAREFAAKGRPLMLMDHPYNRHLRHPLIQRVHGWRDIRAHFGLAPRVTEPEPLLAGSTS